MIRTLIDKLNRWYNSRDSWVQLGVLSGFCLTSLVLLWLAIRYIQFDVRSYNTKVPAYIGRPSGPEFKDSTKHQKQ
ncbi:hypothetical protein EOD41_16850 [Mucilaginibacter limnophilus]|uniref:Uncharacterized protein n=1 Tax=Mucilaginibacter limnophilus TaxID=1932778 RepID=A0A3S2V0A9_9SPHI|nr:hypothetical protein [Mucilaginibacter limnophilus]RVT98458.1 hypothetical protein EOD41_16850 [Mucilaginibacter limnophilus]